MKTPTHKPIEHKITRGTILTWKDKKFLSKSFPSRQLVGQSMYDREKKYNTALVRSKQADQSRESCSKSNSKPEWDSRKLEGLLALLSLRFFHPFPQNINMNLTELVYSNMAKKRSEPCCKSTHFTTFHLQEKIDKGTYKRKTKQLTNFLTIRFNKKKSHGCKNCQPSVFN